MDVEDFENIIKNSNWRGVELFNSNNESVAYIDEDASEYEITKPRFRSENFDPYVSFSPEYHSGVIFEIDKIKKAWINGETLCIKI